MKINVPKFLSAKIHIPKFLSLTFLNAYFQFILYFEGHNLFYLSPKADLITIILLLLTIFAFLGFITIFTSYFFKNIIILKLGCLILLFSYPFGVVLGIFGLIKKDTFFKSA